MIIFPWHMNVLDVKILGQHGQASGQTQGFSGFVLLGARAIWTYQAYCTTTHTCNRTPISLINIIKQFSLRGIVSNIGCIFRISSQP